MKRDTDTKPLYVCMCVKEIEKESERKTDGERETTATNHIKSSNQLRKNSNKTFL